MVYEKTTFYAGLVVGCQSKGPAKEDTWNPSDAHPANRRCDSHPRNLAKEATPIRNPLESKGKQQKIQTKPKFFKQKNINQRGRPLGPKAWDTEESPPDSASKPLGLRTPQLKGSPVSKTWSSFRPVCSAASSGRTPFLLFVLSFSLGSCW